MSLLQYSKCSIRFMPTNSKYQRDYSDRSLIELREDGNDQYSLRGVDVENNNAKIFELPLTEGLYKFGSSLNNWDEIRGPNGIYRLLLNSQTEDNFRKELRQSLHAQNILKKNLSNIPSDKSQSSIPPKVSTKVTDQENILITIHELDKYIENGNIEEAADLASKLASKHVKLKSTILDSKLNDEKLQIRVKIDSIDLLTNEPQIFNVYKSTTIRELRVVFEYTHGYPPSTQYFFINGYFVDENASMNDLDIHPNSIFVLFLIQQ